MARAIIRVLCMTFLFGLTSDALGTDEKFDRLVLRAERSVEGRFEQIAMTFFQDEIILTTNSNFIAPAEMDKTSLGRFSSIWNGRLENSFKLLHQIRLRHPRNTDPELRFPPESPHQTRLWIDLEELDPKSSFGKAAFEILSEAWNLTHWSPQDGVEVKIESGSDATSRPLRRIKGTPTELSTNCEKRGTAQLLCKIPGYGTAYLKR